MSDSIVTLRITRYDPSKDEGPRITEHDVPWKECMTVLQALQYVNEHYEPVHFDYSCRGGLCGRCGCTVDGTPQLACYTALEKGTHTIEPLAGFPVIRDLTVDKGAFTRKLDDSVVAVVSQKDMSVSPPLPYDLYWDVLDRLQKCRECGACVAACPVCGENSAAYAGPAVFGQLYLRANDGLDEADRVMQAVEGGVFSCRLCGMCDSVCSAGIDHVSAHANLRKIATERGLEPTDASVVEAV